MAVKMKFRMNGKMINDIKLDELELPLSDKLLFQCSSDKDGSPEFSFDQDMMNHQFGLSNIQFHIIVPRGSEKLRSIEWVQCKS